MLENVKKAMRITSSAYNTELTNLINAGLADLKLTGIPVDSLQNDYLILMAVITYCRMRFGSPSDYDRIKAAYDEQKAQLMSATGYGLGDD